MMDDETAHALGYAIGMLMFYSWVVTFWWFVIVLTINLLAAVPFAGLLRLFNWRIR